MLHTHIFFMQCSARHRFWAVVALSSLHKPLSSSYFSQGTTGNYHRRRDTNMALFSTALQKPVDLTVPFKDTKEAMFSDSPSVPLVTVMI